MATISFWAGEGFSINSLAGSGLGFYGSDGFGASIDVGSWNGKTYITDSTGTTQGAEVDNVKYLNAQSGYVAGATSGINILNIPNYQTTVNVRFEHPSAVQVQQAKLYLYDRSSRNNNPSGVTVKVAEVIHPSTSQLVTGSGDDVWVTAAGSGTTVALANSPGSGGHFASNGTASTHSSMCHDWYVAVSVSPDTVGSSLFAVLMSLEYF